VDWSKWLAQHGGKRVKAPRSQGSADYRPIEPAPGRYVKVRAI
jgi:polyhydroxyalkanoate synthase